MAKKNKFGVASIPGRNEEIIISVNPKEQPPYQQQTGDALDRERNKKHEQDAARIRSLFDFYVPTAEEIEWCVRYEYKTGFEVIGYDKPKDRQTFLEFAEYNIQWFRDFARDAAKSAAMDFGKLAHV